MSEAWRQSKPDLARTVVKESLEELRCLWLRREHIATTAMTSNSLEATTSAVRKIAGFGGTGFGALVMDLTLMPLMPSPVDAATYTTVGPGARLGLNLLVGDPPGANSNNTGAKCEKYYLGLLLQLRDLQKQHFQEMFPDVAFEMSAHDVQFQLCGKVLRYRQGNRSLRLYGKGNLQLYGRGPRGPKAPRERRKRGLPSLGGFRVSLFKWR